MRDELTDHEWAAIGPMLEAGRPPTGERPSRSQWHLLGVAIWSTLARSARQFRSLYHLLQPFVRWRLAGVWSRIMNALAMTHDTAVQMMTRLLSTPISTVPASLGTDDNPWVGHEAD